jgi:hypothetical protein
MMTLPSNLAENPLTEPMIQSGTCYVLFAYDAARSINLDEAERWIQETTKRETIKHKRKAPSYFEYQPPPLRIMQEIEPVNLGRYRVDPSVDLLAYDFGAVAVTYRIPLRGPLEKLQELSEELYDNDFLLADSRLRVNQLLKGIGEAVIDVGLANVVEDYVIYHIESFVPYFDISALGSTKAQSIAKILRAEGQPLSNQEVEDALTAKISFGLNDLTIVDWNAALIVDREGDDIRAVLEFANVELLEMRYLDQRLDRALDRAYEALSRRSWNLLRMFGYYSADLRRVAELQVDNALLFEGVNNTLKLLGDQYLARVYALINRRFHLGEWDSSILRKLQTLESIYEKISHQATNRRMEILEWVIIFLIALSVVLELIRYGR